MSDFYKHTLVTQSKQVLKFVATITGVTKGMPPSKMLRFAT